MRAFIDDYIPKTCLIDESLMTDFEKEPEVFSINTNESPTLNDETKDYSKGQTILIPQGIKHRIENKGQEKVVFIEVQTGTYFGEDDIVRIEDDYNRT